MGSDMRSERIAQKSGPPSRVRTVGSRSHINSAPGNTGAVLISESKANRIATYQARLNHAHAALRFWNAEYCRLPDAIAEEGLREARKSVGVITSFLYDLQRPGTDVLPTAAESIT